MSKNNLKKCDKIIDNKNLISHSESVCHYNLMLGK